MPKAGHGLVQTDLVEGVPTHDREIGSVKFASNSSHSMILWSSIGGTVKADWLQATENEDKWNVWKPQKKNNHEIVKERWHGRYLQWIKHIMSI